MAKVNFIGIGAKKAATSWIAKCLGEHPEISMYEGKETHFFSRDRRYEKGIEYYESLFPDTPTELLRGEFSTSYLSDEKAVARIKEYDPEMKLIVCLRSPIERAWSHFDHLITNKEVDEYASLKDTLKEHPDIIVEGLYAKHLTRYLLEFPKDQVLMLFYDDIARDPEALMRRIYAFLGVKQTFVPEGAGQRHNTGKVRHSVLYRFALRVYQFLNRYEIGRSFISSLKKLGFSAYSVNTALSLFSPSKIRTMTDEERHLLRGFYLIDIGDLEEITGRDLSEWKK